MFRNKKNIVGLDIGSSSIKAIELTEDNESLRITGFRRLDIGSEESRPDALAELFHQGKFHTKHVVSAVSGKSVIVRYGPMVKMSAEELKSAVRFEAEKFFPFDVAEMQLDFQILGDIVREEGREGPPEMRVLLVGVKRSLVEDQAKMLINLGLFPTVIDVDVFALGNAFELKEALRPELEEPGQPIALLDLGANKTNINILANGNSCFAREVYVGGNDFTAAIARQLGLELHEAETLKRNPKDDEDVQKILTAIGPVLDDLTNEVKLSFDFFEHESESALTKVFLSGGGSMGSYFEGAMERAVERETKRWNPLDGIEVDEDKVNPEELQAWAPSLAVAMGLTARRFNKESTE